MLASALQSTRAGLRPTETVVTHRDGHRTIEQNDVTIGTLPPSDILPPALQPERKRLCIEPPTAPTWALPPFDDFALPPQSSLRTLRVVTWNVWFAPQSADERMAALFSEALSNDPDVLCLQEVVPELAASVRGCAALRKQYAISENNVGAYGCLLLARHALRASFHEVAFECSNMGRSLLIAEWSPPLCEGRRVAVATTHLESLNNARTRAKQLRIAADALSRYKQAMIVGDFNFDSTQNWGDWREIPPRPQRPQCDSAGDDEYAGPVRQPTPELENEVLDTWLNGYTDAWPALRPDEAGHTFDGATNPHIPDAQERMRYDRVMVRGMVAKEITMLGTLSAAAPENDDASPPSDHYGLCAVIDLAE